MIQAASLTDNAFDEKRQSVRRPLFCKVRLIFARESVGGRALDISTGGLAVVADINPPTGETCTASFPLPAPDGTSQELTLQATVLHTVLTHEGFRLGLRFMHADEQAQRLLKRFVGG
ncbi:MAG: PilZ domain-containing protein [Rhodocyclaceae bacterium]|nr:PilZ domain-containing protein [Rhodocyclaceae bacterium]